METKKPYEAPMVTRVSLDIKNAVLSVCHSSMIMDPMDLQPGCKQNGQCAM
jgi:hypothetical protein